MNLKALESGWLWESEFRLVNNSWGLHQLDGQVNMEEIEKVEMKRKLAWFYAYFEGEAPLQISWHPILLCETWVWTTENKIYVGWVNPLQIDIDILTDNAFRDYGIAKELEEDLSLMVRYGGIGIGCL